MRWLALLLVPALALAQRAPGNPLDHLPKNIEVLTHFGERADISPDNQRVAFMTKSFGDAMVVDLKTRVIQCLTCNVPAAAFLRVMHLVTGDYILIGPDHFENVHISRTRDNELWFLSKERGAKPVNPGRAGRRTECPQCPRGLRVTRPGCRSNSTALTFAPSRGAGMVDVSAPGTEPAVAAVRGFLGGPDPDGDRWRFEFGEHLESNWGAVYGGALAAGALAAACCSCRSRSFAAVAASADRPLGIAGHGPRARRRRFATRAARWRRLRSN